MTQADRNIAKSKIAMIEDKPLKKIEHVRGDINVLFEEGKEVYALQFICSMRFYKGDEYVFASHDMYQAIDSIFNYDDFIHDDFAWYEKGVNKLDEAIDRHFAKDNFGEYVIQEVLVKQFGDLEIRFTNGYVMEVFCDASGHSENWRFGILGAEKPLVVVAGIGLDHEMMDRG